MTHDTSEKGTVQLKGNVKCPECGYWGQDYTEKENVMGQSTLECPECGWWQ